MRCRAQRLAFESAAQFQLANYELVEVRRRSEGYGSIIVRLRGAKALCEEAEAVAAETPDVHIDIRDLYTACSSLLTELERDNQTVYLEVGDTFRFMLLWCICWVKLFIG